MFLSPSSEKETLRFIHADVESHAVETQGPDKHSEDTHLRLTSKSAKSLWLPDTHFINEKRAYPNASLVGQVALYFSFEPANYYDGVGAL